VVTSAFPIIGTPDLVEMLRFYQDLLGGVVTYRFPAEGDAQYVGIDLGSSHLGLGQDDAVSRGAQQRFSLWVYVDDCHDAVATLRQAGVPVLAEPAVQVWGETVARVSDPDGNTVIVGSAARVRREL